jgi:hypothetical protein
VDRRHEVAGLDDLVEGGLPMRVMIRMFTTT